MVLIKKRNKTMTVTRSAYENFYKQNGWSTANGEKDNNENVEPIPVNEEITDSDEGITDDDWADLEEEENETEGVEKPLSEMNRQELEAKALEMGLDISEVKSNKQLRELIRNNQ